MSDIVKINFCAIGLVVVIGLAFPGYVRTIEAALVDGSAAISPCTPSAQLEAALYPPVF